MPQAVEEENDAQYEEKVVIARDHVLGPEINERDDLSTVAVRHKTRIGPGNAMGGGFRAERHEHNYEHGSGPAPRKCLHGEMSWWRHEATYRYFVICLNSSRHALALVL